MNLVWNKISLFKLLHNKNYKINDHLRMLIAFGVKKYIKNKTVLSALLTCES